MAETHCGLPVGYDRGRCGLSGDRLDLDSYGLLVLPVYARERIRVAIHSGDMQHMRPGPGPNAIRFPVLTTLLTSLLLVTIPFLAMGPVHHSIG